MSKFLKLASGAAAAFVCAAPVSAVAAVTGSGGSYTITCDYLIHNFSVNSDQIITVTIDDSCGQWTASGAGLSEVGNGFVGASKVFTISPGAVGQINAVGTDGYVDFGITAPPAAVPTMSEWAMILFAVAMAGAAAIVIQKRRTA